MLQRLPESGRPRGHQAWQTGTSVGIHVIIIGAAVWATERPVEIAAARTITPGVTFTAPLHPLPADRSRETPSSVIAAPAPAIPAVTTVPVTVPPVTMDDRRFDPSDYAGTALLQSGPRIAPPGLEGVAARVTLQFVIGTDGRVEPARSRCWRAVTRRSVTRHGAWSRPASIARDGGMATRSGCWCDRG